MRLAFLIQRGGLCLHESTFQALANQSSRHKFVVKYIHIPRHARVMDSVTCEGCSEHVMETRTRRSEGKTLCIPCFDQLEQR